MPLSSSRPDPSRNSGLRAPRRRRRRRGRLRSPGPRRSRHRSASGRSRGTPGSAPRAAARRRARGRDPRPGPRAPPRRVPERGGRPCSTSVTSSPSMRSEAATSEPMKLPPTTRILRASGACCGERDGIGEGAEGLHGGQIATRDGEAAAGAHRLRSRASRRAATRRLRAARCGHRGRRTRPWCRGATRRRGRRTPRPRARVRRPAPSPRAARPSRAAAGCTAETRRRRRS